MSDLTREEQVKADLLLLAECAAINPCSPDQVNVLNTFKFSSMGRNGLLVEQERQILQIRFADRPKLAWADDVSSVAEVPVKAVEEDKKKTGAKR